jgi:Ca2+-binding RTX toxin-like protein
MKAAAVLVSACALCLAVGEPAFTAGNTVPGGTVSLSVFAITADALKPPACSGITLTTVVSGVNGTAGNDLLLGTSGIDVMSGGNGNDCIVGGAGADTIDGGAGTDVCIGGPDVDVFVVLTCETQVQ